MITIPAPSIPTAFVKMDTRVTTNDGFVNVHDQQLMRANHNILLARRMRGNCCAMWWSQLQYARTVTPFLHKLRPPIIYTGSFLVNPLCRIIRFAFRAIRSEAAPAADPVIGFFMWPWGGNSIPYDEDAIAKTSITSTSHTWYEIDFPLRYHFQNDSKIAPRIGGKIPVGFSIYSQCSVDIDSAATIAGATVVTADQRTVRFTTATAPSGDSIEIDGSNQSPAMIISDQDLGADNIVTVDPPFTVAPVAGDTVTTRSITATGITALLINELTISDFDAASAPI